MNREERGGKERGSRRPGRWSVEGGRRRGAPGLGSGIVETGAWDVWKGIETVAALTGTS